MRTIHICQSVEGALLNWSFEEWHHLAVENKTSVRKVKREFIDYIRQGKEVIPLGEPCEGFSYIDGCPGHEKPPEKGGE